MGATSQSADAVIIGGGIIGCAIALRLAESGQKVIVIERGEPAAEASHAAAGMIAPQGENTRLDDFFHLCLRSRDLYPEFIRRLEELSRQDLGYRRTGTLLLATSEQERLELEEIYRVQTAAQLSIERLPRDEVANRVPGLSDQVGAGLFIQGDHWVDNERLGVALAAACERLGVEFWCGKAVTSLKTKNGRVEFAEAGDKFSAGNYVLAAGCWSAELVAPLGIQLAIEPCRGQLIECKGEHDLPFVLRASRHYVVPRSESRFVLGTTVEYAGFDKAVTAEGLRAILQGVSRFLQIGDFRFRRAWAGLRPDTADHLPILGYGELRNLLFATGHFRNGILLAPVTAQIICELITEGRTKVPIERYSPARFSLNRS